MRFRRPLLALATLAYVFAAAADEPSPASATQSLLFRPVSEVVTAQEKAAIFDRPGGNAVFILSTRSRLLVHAVSEDGRWWEIVLPDGNFGYVPTTSPVIRP